MKNYTHIYWQKHALGRMLERGIFRVDVKLAIENGIIIEKYEDDKPFASFLLAYIEGQKPLHVVASFDEKSKELYIITAYEPDLKHFEEDLITRKNDAE
ncbi:DUF4258 domain-containing protein [Sulfurimonas sp. SAG-AH-194-C21]|nr:DUF4258 domain-containing protein [Sulfurimonas sp. SAG-AH-194-C21]MDF1882968.1 DUF4258 domain-containing protein [Sulfurimonas sp. SAG-AH-194-C21]